MTAIVSMIVGARRVWDAMRDGGYPRATTHCDLRATDPREMLVVERAKGIGLS
jgi:hypothetical protein